MRAWRSIPIRSWGNEKPAFGTGLLRMTLPTMRILLADDDKNLRKVLVNELVEMGFSVNEAQSGSEALGLLEAGEYDVLLLDLSMPGGGGMEVLKKVRHSEIPVEVIILTAYATVSTAVEAMKLGAYDYLTKPFQLEQLKAVIDKAYEKKRLLRENLLLKIQIKRQSEKPNIITQNPHLLGILENVKKVGFSDFPVLICGESGVGKELIAKAIHEASARRDGPFIPINCGAIQENLLESELFGHEKGAFTGAYAKKPGLLEVTHQGTLFLDEIGELTLLLQGKLLRVIETGTFFRLGGTKEVKVDVRFVSATNKDVKREVEEGRFREDLYYRVSGLTLSIPPLRERKEDIPLLVEHAIRMTPAFKGKRFSKEAIKTLTEYPWPGNVRELQNVIHRSLLLSNGEVIEPSDLPIDFSAGREKPGRRLEEVERNHILNTLREANGQRRKAAEVLGIDPKTLYRKLLGYGIEET
jgi:DNA-binding NtrC family response regulator